MFIDVVLANNHKKYFGKICDWIPFSLEKILFLSFFLAAINNLDSSKATKYFLTKQSQKLFT
jgi:hypothetical protein